MQPVVTRWSGSEARSLRSALRMSVREFAGRLGCSDRIVSKWEALGSRIRPRPVNAAALDRLLAMAPPDVRVRFAEQFSIIVNLDTIVSVPPDLRAVVRVEPDDRLMALVDAGPHRGRWATGFAVDVLPVKVRDIQAFTLHTGHPVQVDSDGEAPAKVTRSTARLYAGWAGRELPTAGQLIRAGRLQGIVAGHEEWRRDQSGGIVTGAPSGTAPFRTAVPLSRIVEILGIH